MPDRGEGTRPSAGILTRSGATVLTAGVMTISIAVVEITFRFDNGDLTVLFHIVSSQGPGIMFEVPLFVDESDPPRIGLQVVGDLVSQLADQGFFLTDGERGKLEWLEIGHVSYQDNIGGIWIFNIVM